MNLLLLLVALLSSIPFGSIQHLGDIHSDGSVHTFCTIWAVNVEGMIRWITAAHCIERGADGKVDDTIKYVIGNKRANLIKLDVDKDLAMFLGPGAKGLQIALGEASVGQKVFSFGYFWAQSGVYIEGVASIPNEGDAVFNLTAGPGASGSPVLTEGNIVVGVMQFTACKSMVCPIVAGATVKELREFLFTTRLK